MFARKIFAALGMLLERFPFGRPVVIYGSCRRCGRCCRNMTLVVDGVRITSERAFLKLVERKPEYGRLFVNGRDSRGRPEFSCSWLTPENECRDHERRLDVCSGFPSKPMYYLGGGMPSGCGYRFVRKGKFEATLRRMRKSGNS